MQQIGPHAWRRTQYRNQRCATRVVAAIPAVRLEHLTYISGIFTHVTPWAPLPGHICPFTGGARLSYRRAEEIFRAASGGWTLHQLRHSAITHLAEDNVALPMLMAKRPHKPAVPAEVRQTEPRSGRQP